jgi:hypothetical protein
VDIKPHTCTTICISDPALEGKALGVKDKMAIENQEGKNNTLKCKL